MQRKTEKILHQLADVLREHGYIIQPPKNDEAESGGRGRPPEARGTAERFLLRRLTDGPVRAKQIFADAEREGINKKTLQRAKKGIGIESRRLHGIPGPWSWVLPDIMEIDRALKPCPFCGSNEARVKKAPYYPDPAHWLVQCYVCDAKGSAIWGAENAADAWNKRP